MYNIWNDCVSIGDTICSFPGALELAKAKQKQHGKVRLAWTNEAVGDLFPHEKYGITRVERCHVTPLFERVSIHDMVHYPQMREQRGFAPKCEHPTAQFMAFCGFPELSEKPIQPEIVYGDYDAKTFEVVISPYILAEIDRFWPLERWQHVIDWCNSRGLSVAVVCGSKIPPLDDLKKVNPYSQAHFSSYAAVMKRSLINCEYIVDRPLGEVAWLMSRARAVVTVDSGPARLAYAVGVGRRHVLLCHNAVSREWGANPGCTLIYKNLREVRPADVIPIVESVL